MALITCPECGKEVSDMAKMCPNCGYPINDPTVPDVKNNICVFKGQRYDLTEVLECVKETYDRNGYTTDKKYKARSMLDRAIPTIGCDAGELMTGTESAEGPAGSPGILVADGSDQSDFSGIIAFRKRPVGTGVGVSRSVVRKRGKPRRWQSGRNISGRNGSACHKAGTGQNQRADNIS